MQLNHKIMCTLTLLFLANTAMAQDWARERVETSPRHLEWVTVKAEQRELRTYVAYPERADKATAIVLIHEIFGHSDWFRLMADNLAEAGYVVVAPDLLSGMAPNGGATADFPNIEATRKAIGELEPAQITSDLKAAVEYAKKIPAANGKVVVAGFCWGGTQTFRFATNSDQLEAAFVFYGSGPDDEAELKRITAPVYGFYAENDARVNATLEASEKAMKSVKKVFFPLVYEGGGHGFMRAGGDPEATEGNKQARVKAFQRLLELLELI